MNNKKIAIIGSGIAGLACAARLNSAGIKPVIFDKGRGIGGRLATRRADNDLQFDHGAQYVTARTSGFEEFLFQAENIDRTGIWRFGDGSGHVGVGGMNEIAKTLGQGLDVRQNIEVNAIREVSHGCEIGIANETQKFAIVVSTVPAPQASNLLSEHHDFAGELSEVELLPCLGLMAAFKIDCQAPFVASRTTDDLLSWIAHDSSKPGRPPGNCWVAHASPSWSMRHLEEQLAEIAEKMSRLLCDRLGFQCSDLLHAAAHRWRYAFVSKPLGSSFIRNEEGTLYLGGDWCIGARVEAAWTSGTAIAEDILESG